MVKWCCINRKRFGSIKKRLEKVLPKIELRHYNKSNQKKENKKQQSEKMIKLNNFGFNRLLVIILLTLLIIVPTIKKLIRN